MFREAHAQIVVGIAHGDRCGLLGTRWPSRFDWQSFAKTLS
jgi:hypothetical protein